MFDSVLGAGNTAKSRFGTGTTISVLAHVGILGFALWISNRPPAEKEKETDVKFFAAPPPPPPPPPPAGGGSTQPKVERKKVEKKVVKRDTIVQPKEIPTEKPAEAEPEPEKDDSPAGEEGGVVGGVEGGVKGGVVGGVVGGVLGGQLGGTLGGDVMSFGAGMTRPEQIAGRAPVYSREALEARIQGLMMVNCVINKEGELSECKVIKALPYMEKAVLDALKGYKYKPVMYQGRPVSVRWTIPIKLVMPNR